MKHLRWYDYITYNVYWFALSMGSAALTPLVLPLLVQHFVAADVKNTALGMLRASGLIVAVLIQPAAGLLSDRSASRWGRRRPFIAVGGLLSATLVLGVAAAPGYWSLFVIMLFLQFASNIAHGALQGIIPDQVPEGQRGRISGVKAIMELAPTIIVALAFSAKRMAEPGQFWFVIGLVAACYVLGMLITIARVHETPLREPPAGPLREPMLRVLGLLLGVGLGVLIGALLGGLGGGLVGLVTWALAGQAQARLVGVAVAGLIAIVTAIVAGVWLAVHFSADARRYPAFTWWVVNRLLYLAAVGAVQGFALYYMKDVLKVANYAGVTAQLMAVVGVFMLLAALPSGFLADRIERRTLVALAGLLATMGLLVIIMTSSVMVVLVAGCAIGVATGIFFTANWALGTDLVPPEEAGRFLGISNLAGAGAGIVSGMLGGPLADYFNRASPGLGYRVIFGIFGLCFLLSAVVLTRVRRPAAGRVQAAAPQGS